MGQKEEKEIDFDWPTDNESMNLYLEAILQFSIIPKRIYDFDAQFKEANK